MRAFDLRGFKPTATISSRYAAKTKNSGSYFGPRCYIAGAAAHAVKLDPSDADIIRRCDLYHAEWCST